ncbi:MAG: hypothetical protein AAF310_01460 [Myxococcota bacterium]
MQENSVKRYRTNLTEHMDDKGVKPAKLDKVMPDTVSIEVVDAYGSCQIIGEQNAA